LDLYASWSLKKLNKEKPSIFGSRILHDEKPIKLSNGMGPAQEVIKYLDNNLVLKRKASGTSNKLVNKLGKCIEWQAKVLSWARNGEFSKGLFHCMLELTWTPLMYTIN